MAEVFVGEVYHPGKFFVQLREMSIVLDDMMAEMDDFYSGPEGWRLRMQSASVLVGQYCVAQDASLGMWTRAIVKNLKDIETVVVSLTYVSP